MICQLFQDKEIIYRSVLKDNTPAIYYFVGPECKECIARGLTKLSLTSIHSRFNSSFKQFSDDQLNFLTILDYKNHLALGAGNFDFDDYPGMGIARYIRLDDPDDTAEIAITILDKYQNLGLGTLLLCLLIKFGVQNNIPKFGGYVNINNKWMIKILRKFHFKDMNIEGNLIYFEVKIEHVLNQALEILDKNKETIQMKS